jgi:hypothetical protein
VTLEELLRRFIRDAAHERVRGVPDVPLSEASDPSCVRNGPMILAEAARYCGFRSTAAFTGCSETTDIEFARCANEVTFRCYGEKEYLAEAIPKLSGDPSSRISLPMA